MNTAPQPEPLPPKRHVGQMSQMSQMGQGGQAGLPFAVGAVAQAEGVPLSAIFDIADEHSGDLRRKRALLIAQSCLSSWLRHAHLGDLELHPSQEEFCAVEARRRQVFDEVALTLAQVEAAQRQNDSSLETGTSVRPQQK